MRTAKIGLDLRLRDSGRSGKGVLTLPWQNTSETLGRMGTSFWCSDFWHRLGGHAIFVIGRS